MHNSERGVCLPRYGPVKLCALGAQALTQQMLYICIYSCHSGFGASSYLEWWMASNVLNNSRDREVICGWASQTLLLIFFDRVVL